MACPYGVVGERARVKRVVGEPTSWEGSRMCSRILWCDGLLRARVGATLTKLLMLRYGIYTGLRGLVLGGGFYGSF